MTGEYILPNFPTTKSCYCQHKQAQLTKFAVLGGWTSLPVLMLHIPSLLHCFNQSPPLESTFIIYNTTCLDKLVEEFFLQHDPSQIMRCIQFSPQPSNSESVVTVPLNQALISSIENPNGLSSKAVLSGIIIDSGASVCTSPHRSGFVIHSTRKMKIKDLSSSNQVATGQGILS